MKLLANENFPKDSVLFLRNLGYDVLSIGDDNPSITDKAIMEIAKAQERIILTFDRDYGELIYKYNYKPPRGIIYLRLEVYTSEEPGKHVHDLLNNLKIETAGCLTVFDGKNLRQRKY